MSKCSHFKPMLQVAQVDVTWSALKLTAYARQLLVIASIKMFSFSVKRSTFNLSKAKFCSGRSVGSISSRVGSMVVYPPPNCKRVLLSWGRKKESKREESEEGLRLVLFPNYYTENRAILFKII